MEDTMNNKIYEEALASALIRIEVLEDKMSRISLPNDKGFYEPAKKVYNQKPGQATPGQIKYLSSLGFESFSGLTKVQAGKEIDKLVKTKKLIEKEGQMAQEMVEKYGDEEIPEVKEPKEVDTEDIGIDDEGFI